MTLPVTPRVHTRQCGRGSVVLEVEMADRRAGKVPHVRETGGGKQPRARNQDGSWRAKRSDAGKPRDSGKKGKR